LTLLFVDGVASVGVVGVAEVVAGVAVVPGVCKGWFTAGDDGATRIDMRR
jgi:hypothetical protein